jgi:hypothetical protein
MKPPQNAMLERVLIAKPVPTFAERALERSVLPAG